MSAKAERAETNDAERSLDPDDWDALRELGRSAVDDMIEYLRTVGERPVWQPLPDSARSLLTEPLPEQASPREQVYAQIKDNVLPYPTGNIKSFRSELVLDFGDIPIFFHFNGKWQRWQRYYILEVGVSIAIDNRGKDIRTGRKGVMETQPYRFGFLFLAAVGGKIIRKEAEFRITFFRLCRSKFCLDAGAGQQAYLEKHVVNVLL